MKKTPLFNLKVLAIVLLTIVFSFSSCTDAKATKEAKMDKEKYLAEKNEVKVIYLINGAFQKELVSNGKLVAVQKNILKFEVSEKLQFLKVHNGSVVQKNQELASLNAFTYQQRLEKAAIDVKKAKLELEDLLVGRGFDTKDIANIPKAIYEMVSIRSGYQEALRQLKNAQFELKSTKLRAPFKGKVANIKRKQYEHVGAGQEFMTLINDALFEVEFYLIESEIKEVAVNDKVQIIPFAFDKIYEGRVATINPLVEKNGTILVKAKVKNDGNLLEGMNVKVHIHKQIKDQFVVPKSAVILRQNQEVLFKVHEGKAFWTYVKTTRENSSSYAVIPHPDKSSAQLKIGDTIITSGNLNLAHDSEVSIRK